jgi:hypothetical protein
MRDGIDNGGRVASGRVSLPRVTEERGVRAQVFRLLPRLVATLGAVVAACWGVTVAWHFATDSNAEGGAIAAIGMLLLVTPLVSVTAALLGYWTSVLYLKPVEWVVENWQQHRNP